MIEKQPQFAFGKKLGINECLYGNIPKLSEMIARLLYCMKETNKIHNVSCEFFRLDFRQMTFEEDLLTEFPYGSFVLDLKFGSKKELEEKAKDDLEK
jgi:hypothetical protein